MFIHYFYYLFHHDHGGRSKNYTFLFSTSQIGYSNQTIKYHQFVRLFVWKEAFKLAMNQLNKIMVLAESLTINYGAEPFVFVDLVYKVVLNERYWKKFVYNICKLFKLLNHPWEGIYFILYLCWKKKQMTAARGHKEMFKQIVEFFVIEQNSKALY